MLKSPLIKAQLFLFIIAMLLSACCSLPHRKHDNALIPFTKKNYTDINGLYADSGLSYTLAMSHLDPYYREKNDSSAYVQIKALNKNMFRFNILSRHKKLIRSVTYKGHIRRNCLIVRKDKVKVMLGIFWTLETFKDKFYLTKQRQLKVDSYASIFGCMIIMPLDGRDMINTDVYNRLDY